MRRLILVLILVIGLSPGLLWRNGPRAPDHSQALLLTPLIVPPDVDEARVGDDGPVLTGAWRMSSPNTGFGGYSALVATGANELLAISDRGQFLRIPMPGTPGKTALGTVEPAADQYKTSQDMESATRDPVSGRLWIGLEFQQAIVRTEADFSHLRLIAPPQMKHWHANGGLESMARLADGRFVLLSETPPRDRLSGARAGLLFPRDPLTGTKPLEFSFVPPDGYDPSDMAQLPDGRLLIVLRGLNFFPPGFAIRLVIADPGDIRAGKDWPWQDVGELAPPTPIDNYEGLAVTGGENGGPVTLWLVSDDNSFLVIQHSLLLRFKWQVPPRSALK